MKKCLITTSLCLLTTVTVLAQGRINFSNSSALPLRISNPAINGGMPVILGTASTASFGIGPASVRVRLFAGLTPTSLVPISVGTCSCLPYVTNTASGIASAQGTFNGGANLPLPFDGTQPVYLQFRVDSINNGLYSKLSTIILVDLATNGPATPVFGSSLGFNQWNGLTIGEGTYELEFVTQPQSQTVAAGSNFVLSAVAQGGWYYPITYQWQHYGTNIPGATNFSYSVVGATNAHAGDYQAVAKSVEAGLPHLVSDVATITLVDPIQFSMQPSPQIAPLYGSVTFSALASGSPAPSYQWLFNNQIISGANSTNLVLTNIGTNALGDYSVIASNSYSVVTSTVAALYMSPSLLNPFSGIVAVWGREATLNVFAQGSGELSYQWFHDGLAVSDATNATLVFPSVQFTNGGLYHVVVTSAFGSVTNVPAQLVINPANVSLGLLGLYAAITIEGVPDYTYGIEYSTNLSDLNAWTALTNVTLMQPVQLWIDTSVESRGPGNNGRYYRVTALGN